MLNFRCANVPTRIQIVIDELANRPIAQLFYVSKMFQLQFLFSPIVGHFHMSL